MPESRRVCWRGDDRSCPALVYVYEMFEAELGDVRGVVGMTHRMSFGGNVPAHAPAAVHVAVVLAIQQPAAPEQADVPDDA